LRITTNQLKAARALLDWTQEDLANKARVALGTIQKFENGIHSALQGATEAAILKALSPQIEFTGTRGVALKSDELVMLTGESAFPRVLDDIITTLSGAPKPEALFACVSDRLSPPAVVENYRRLRKQGIAMRSLVREGDTYLMGKPREYRILPARYFHNNAIAIYQDKVATMILDPVTHEDRGAIIVRNAHVAAAQRNLFNFIWSQTPTPAQTTAETRYE